MSIQQPAYLGRWNYKQRNVLLFVSWKPPLQRLWRHQKRNNTRKLERKTQLEIASENGVWNVQCGQKLQ